MISFETKLRNHEVTILLHLNQTLDRRSSNDGFEIDPSKNLKNHEHGYALGIVIRASK